MEHTAIQQGEIHSPYQWIVTDATARAAIVPESTDADKLCLQRSDKRVYRLVTVSPVTWEVDHKHDVADITGLGAGFDGDYNSLSNKPTLGTAAPLNVAASGNAASGEVVKGDDTRLGDARTPTAHSHAISSVTGLQDALDAKGTSNFDGDFNSLSNRPFYVPDVVGDGVFDDTAAIQAALSSGAKEVRLPAGTFKLTSTLTISTNGVSLRGAGIDATILVSSATGPAINVASGLSGVVISDLHLKRAAGTAVSGDDGIKFTSLTEQAIVTRVKLSRHWVGLSLCATSYSLVSETIVQHCYSHGVQVANNATYAGLQWSFLKCLSQTNNGYGLLYTTAAGAAPASVGDISLFSTYANKLGGVKFAGTATSPINAIRWFGGFVGEDGGHGMELDTYGSSSHKIEGLFAELAGTAACGVDNSTAAPNVGHGILVTANNTSVDIYSCEVIGNSNSGIDMSASRFSIVSTNTRINGAAGSGQRNGIRCRAGQGAVIACSSKGNPFYGVFIDVDSVAVVGCDLRENTTAGFGFVGGTAVSSPVVGNFGTSVINMANASTGWVAMTGTGNKGTALDVSTATLPQLAARVKELQDLVTAMGACRA